ncbi:MAG: transcription termination/antitermination protein NusA [Robiginitalea sp.]
MENLALIESFSEFKDDKFIDRVTLMAILEEVSEAQKIEPDFEIGEDVSEEVKLKDLGRRSILALRQNLIAKIHEHDNTTIYKQFKDLEGEIYTAEVHHIRHRAIILLDDEGNELIMPKEKQIPSDFFRKGDNVRGIIESVDLKGNKPLINMSRTAPVFLEQLFHQEIEKAKVAVDSYDDRIDPVGACVGMKGSRIHGIVRELGNENIDVINWTNNPQLMVTRALSPARVSMVKLNDENMTAQVYLKPEEVSKAIGRGGHNIRLAGKLTGYEIDVFREGVEEDVELTEFSDEIEDWSIGEFRKIGLDTARSVLEQDVEDLVKRTDLEEETIRDVIRILKEEFED